MSSRRNRLSSGRGMPLRRRGSHAWRQQFISSRRSAAGGRSRNASERSFWLRSKGAAVLRHYLLMTLRSFARHKLYSFINIAGLSVGMAAAILIALYVRDQLSYDAWIPGTEHLYRLERGTWERGEGIPHTA